MVFRLNKISTTIETQSACGASRFNNLFLYYLHCLIVCYSLFHCVFPITTCLVLIRDLRKDLVCILVIPCVEPVSLLELKL